MIDLEQVHFAYPDTGHGVAGVSAHISAGERVALLGPNACGKSTLLRLINGLLFPDFGTVRFEGEAVTSRKLRDRAWQRWFRRQTAFLFQDPDAMLFNASVLEEIAFGPRQHGLPRPEERARSWAEGVGLGERLACPPFRLSGGQKQRLALASVLVLEPRLLLLDEPTASLDAGGIRWLLDHLEQRSELALVVATHHWGVAERLANRVLILDERQQLAWDGDLVSARREHGLLERLGLLF